MVNKINKIVNLKNFMLGLLLFVAILGSLALVNASVDVDTCRSLNITDEVYILNASIITSGNGECLQIKAENITLDLNGYNLTSNAAGYGIDVYNNSANIKNGYIFNFSYGIYFESGLDNTVNNMTLKYNSNFGINGGRRTNISNSVISYNKNGMSIRYNQSLVNVTLIDNQDDTIRTNTNNGGNILKNIYINTNYDSSNDGVIYINSGSEVVRFIDSTFITNQSIFLNLKGTTVNNTFLNCSYETNKENVSSTSQLTRQWYFNVDFLDNESNLLEVNYSLYSSDASLIISSNGSNLNTNLTEYINNGSQTYLSPYRLVYNASNNRFGETSFNLTQLQNVDQDIIVLSPAAALPEPTLADKILKVMIGILCLAILGICLRFAFNNLDNLGEGIDYGLVIKTAITIIVALILIKVLAEAI